MDVDCSIVSICRLWLDHVPPRTPARATCNAACIALPHTPQVLPPPPPPSLPITLLHLPPSRIHNLAFNHPPKASATALAISSYATQTPSRGVIYNTYRQYIHPTASMSAEQPSQTVFPPAPSLSSRPSTSSLRSVPPPPSPRSPSRHASISHSSMADLLSTPPLPKQEGAIPRDWRSVSAGELVEGQELRYVELDTPVESACQVRQTSN